MPPKRPRKTTNMPSQEDQIQAVFQQLSSDLDHADKTSGLISFASTTLEVVNEILKACRADAKLINHPYINGFASQLEDDAGDNLCRYLDAESFSTTVRVILQMEACNEAERGLHLLAASLFYESLEFEHDNDIDNKKDEIGTNCLLQLLNFLVDDEKDFGMRRWAGLLCIQLVTGCERNHTKLEQTPDEARRSIGRQVVEESDEILRIIHAQLVRAMIDNGTPLGSFFPLHYEENIYADFPPSSQGSAGWGVQFQRYLDGVYQKMDALFQVGFLFFAATVQLTPEIQLGARHHNTVLFVDGKQLSLLAPSRENYFDSVLDVPLSSIKTMAFALDNTSQLDSQRVMVEMEDNDVEDSKISCYIDAKAVAITRLAFSIDSKSVDSFQSAVLQSQDGIEIVDAERSQYNGSDNSQRTKKVVTMDLGESQARTQKISQADLGETIDTCHPHGPQPALVGDTELTQYRLQMPQADQDASESIVDEVAMHDPQEEDDIYNATPKKPHDMVAGPQVELAKPKPVATRKRKTVKPKAKPPIVSGRYSLGSQLKVAKSLSQLDKSRPVKDDTGPAQKDKLLPAKASPAAKMLAGSSTSANRTEKNSIQSKIPSKALTAANSSSNTSTRIKPKPAPKKSTASGAAESKTLAAVQAADPAYGFSEDDLDTNPDANDASTLELTKTKSIKPPLKQSGSESASNLSKPVRPSAPPRKKYGLHKATESTSHDQGEVKLMKDKSKAVKEAANSKSKAAPKSEASKKVEAKKRQSAPAALPAARKSKRAAASKAINKIQGIVDSRDEIEDLLPTKPKSQITEDKKPSAAPKSAKPKPHSAAEDQGTYDLQADDARSLGLVIFEPPIDLDNGEDPTDASPREPVKTQKHVPNMSNKPAKPSVAGQMKAIDSGLNTASKLSDSPVSLESDSDEHDEPQLPLPKKFQKTKKLQVEDAPTQANSDRIKAGASEQQADEEFPGKMISSLGHNEDPQFIVGEEHAVCSPAGVIPEDPTPTSDNPDPEEGFQGAPSPPIMQGCMETGLETQVLVDVIQSVAKQSVQERDSQDGLNAASGSDGNVAVERSILTEVRQVDVLDVSRKRKTTTEKPATVKRRRIGEKDPQEVQEQDLTPAQETGAMAIAKTSRTPKMRSPSSTRKSPRLAARIRKLSPTRKSPRLAAMPAKSAAELNKTSPEVSSIIKDPSRKPKVINFSGQGPQNQGVASAAKPKAKTVAVEVGDEASHAAPLVEGRKRRRENAQLTQIASPPKKKLNSSPVVDDFHHDVPVPIEKGSSPLPRVAKSKLNRHRLVSKPSSQASRVDRNGSPIAGESPVDHFEKLKKSLVVPKIQSESRELRDVPRAVAPAEERPKSRPRRASEIFGPKISLGKKLKAGPSSPGEPNGRYVLHGESHGVYTDVDTMKVVEERKMLVDPFVERSRRSSGFVERLQSSASKEGVVEKCKSKSRLAPRVSQPVRDLRSGQSRSNAEDKLSELPQDKRAPNHGHQRSRFATQPEKTKRHAYEDSSPSDMTSRTSYGSQSSNAARTPVEEVPTPDETWNLAVRPHYNTLHEAVHRIADELIIRLSSEEDRMDLLTNQYKENGTKILDNLIKKRGIERSTISRNLDQKNLEIASVYTESRDVIMETEVSMKGGPTNHFEADWRRKQNAIRKQIAEGRKSSEN